MMSGGRKAVQDGVRVKLRAGSTWDSLAQMTPDEIKAKGLLPAGFMPLPHVSGRNESLKGYAADTLADVMEHLEMAKEQYSVLTSRAPPTK